MDAPPKQNHFVLRCPACCECSTHLNRAEFKSCAGPALTRSQSNGQHLLLAWTCAQTLECQQCGRLTLRLGWSSTPDREHTWSWSTLINPEIEPGVPVRVPQKVEKLYRETRKAFDVGALTLAAVGIRAIIEAICKDRSCKGADLQQKIARLRDHLAPCEVKLLQAQRALGNEAVHQMETPSAEEIATTFAALDHFLKTLYEIPAQIDAMKRLRADRMADDSVELKKAC